MNLADYAPRPAHLRWLLDSDPAIRWQVLRDLTNASPEKIAAERARVATEGWGAELLAKQLPNGTFIPDENPGLLVTFYCLTVLKDLGLDPASPQAREAYARVDCNLIFEWHDNRRFFDGETEPCINGRILSLGAYFDKPRDALAQQLLDEQLADGGWNCEAPPSTVSSFHTTICVLEGLLDYERAGGKHAKAAAKARRRGEEYLLERRLLRSLRTGEVISKRWLRFSFPAHWHYDVLRALDYFRNAGAQPEARMEEALQTVVARRHQNGRWPLNHLHKERIPLDMETEVGRASRWNSLRALRVLKWANGGSLS